MAKKHGEVDKPEKPPAKKSAGTAGLSPNAWKFIDRLQLAELLGVSPDTISDFTAQGMPVAYKGGHSKKSVYDAVACTAWHRQRAESKQLDAREIAQTRLLVAQAERVEHKRDQERGQLVSLDVVRRDGVTFARGVSAKVRAIPRRLVQVGLLTRENEPAAIDLMRDVVTEISAWKTGADSAEAAKK